MMRYFQSLGIHEHDQMLYEMGIKEKEHEVYFLEQIKNSRLLPLFQRFFGWGKNEAVNDVDLENPAPVTESHNYCKTYKARERSEPREAVDSKRMEGRSDGKLSESDPAKL